MNILHIIPSFGLGGMEKVVCSIINRTSGYYKHFLLSINGNNSAFQWIRSNNLEEIDFCKNEGFTDYLQRMYRSIKKASPDLLMTYNWGATDAIWLARCAGIKRIIHNEHGFSIEEARATSWKRDACRLVVYRMASAIITVSSQLKNSLQKKYWLSDKKVQMIPNGIDSDYYSPDHNVRQRIRQELNLAASDYVIVFSGRLDPVKNFDVLLNVFKWCQSTDSKMKLLIVGDGPERQRIEHICRQKNIHGNVVMVGQQLEVLPYLRAGDIFLLTSLTEQMPLTILEAMSVGLPVVASDVGEIRHIIEDGKDGFLRDLRDGWEAFALALLRLKDSGERRAMGQDARAKIVANFQETIMVQRYQAIIENLLGRYGPPSSQTPRTAWRARSNRVQGERRVADNSALRATVR
jgi:glycosyltransferase involved in cell wall biosynthesis